MRIKYLTHFRLQKKSYIKYEASNNKVTIIVIMIIICVRIKIGYLHFYLLKWRSSLFNFCEGGVSVFLKYSIEQ